MWIWIALGAIATLVVALVSVGSVTRLLSTRPRRRLYDLEEAVVYVAERLPGEITAALSYEDVQEVLYAHCQYLGQKGVASGRIAEDVHPDLVVVSDDEPIAFVLGKMEEQDREVPDEYVAEILEVEQGYYHLIGAIGPQVTAPDAAGATEGTDST